MNLTTIYGSFGMGGVDERSEYHTHELTPFTSARELHTEFKARTEEARFKLMDMGRSCSLVENARLRICDYDLITTAMNMPNGPDRDAAILEVHADPSTFYVTLDRYEWAYTLGVKRDSLQYEIRFLTDRGWRVLVQDRPVTLLRLRRVYQAKKHALGWDNARINRAFSRAHKGTLRKNYKEYVSIVASTYAFAKSHDRVTYSMFHDETATFTEDLAAVQSGLKAGPPPAYVRPTSEPDND